MDVASLRSAWAPGGLSIEKTDDRKEAALKEQPESLSGAETRWRLKADQAA